jgi:transketolase C-terminal domain/subunit
VDALEESGVAAGVVVLSSLRPIDIDGLRQACAGVRLVVALELSAWYAGRSFAVLGFFALSQIAPFYTSLGEKPLFGRPLLYD